MNHEVLGVDINPEIVQKVSPYVTHAIVADTTDEEAIKALALKAVLH
ncbi:NAD-binding protein [Veillonella parvula]|nr:NAD-binding protein [Veillonella parvula]MCQ4978370.1 NAD-binding protein [Veillonella parvula]